MIILAGIDEAGRGPVIGPMVIAGVYYIKNKDAVFSEYITKDSKGYTRNMRKKLYNFVINLIDYYKIHIIYPEEINIWMGKGKKLNDLELKYFVEIIRDMINKMSRYNENIELKVFVDSVDVKPERMRFRIYRGVMEDVSIDNIRLEIVCEHKADEKYVPVSIASIIAKVIRDDEIEKLHKILADFGSGYPSDPKTRAFLKEIIRKNSFKKYRKYIRIYWKTLSKLGGDEYKDNR